MSKTLSIVLTSVISFILVFLFVFGFFLSFDFGKYDVYHPAFSLIQLGSEFGDTTVGSYKVDTRVLEDLEQDYDSAAQAKIQKVISSRLGSVYGYFGSTVTFSNNFERLSIEIPKTSSYEKTIADSILANVVVRGLTEICNASTYSEEAAILSNISETKLIRRTTVTKFAESGGSYFVITAVLTDAGFELMSENFTASTSNAAGYIAIDESISSNYSLYWPDHTSRKLTIYCNDELSAKLLVSYLTVGALPATLHEIQVDDVEANPILGIIVAAVVAILAVAALLLMFVKYKSLSIVAVISMLATVVAVLYFASLVAFTVLNIWAVVGFIIGLAVLCYSMLLYFDKIQSFLRDGKSVKYSTNAAYSSNWLKKLIINVGALVLGIVLWVIPTVVTVSLGNALVYVAIMSLFCTFGLNYVMTRFFVTAIAGKDKEAYGVK